MNAGVRGLLGSFVLALAACGPPAAVEPEPDRAPPIASGDEREAEGGAAATETDEAREAASQAQETEPGEGWQITPLACEADADCGLCFYGRIYETSADCECVDCPFDLVAPEECGRRARSFQEVCADQDDRCPSFSCEEPPPMRCIERRCAVRER